MAKPTKDGNDDDRQVLTNLASRQACIQDAFKKLYGMRREKEALEEEHLSGIKEELRKTWRNLKADVDIERKDLNLMFKIYERERLAHEMGEDDAGRIQDNLREAFNALTKGGMVNFVNVLDEAA